MNTKTKDLIRQLTSMLDSNDLTNTTEKKALSEQYAALCRDFNAQAAECQSLSEKKMLAEAARFAETHDLKTLGHALLFPDRDLLLDMCKIYHWSLPEELRTDIVSDILEKVAGTVDVTNLITQYRQIMRTDDRDGKILLLRKIYKLDPKPEWKDTLVTFEKELIGELLNQAKEAIIKQDKEKIQFLGEKLCSSVWLVKAPEAAVNKIKGEMEKFHQQDLEERAKVLSEQISEAFSSFDFDAMTYGMNKWDAFLEEEKYIVPDNLSLQIEQARKWFLEESSIRAKNKRAEELIEGLRAALENDESSLEQLDYFVQNLQIMEWEIPEGLMTRYSNVRTQTLLIRARKRNLLIAAAAIGLILIVALSVWQIYTLIMNQNEREWLAKIEATLKKQDPESGLKLLDSLAKKSPNIRKRVTILEAENKVNRLKKDQVEQRKSFKEQIADCRRKLLKYRENRDVIKELSAKLGKLVLDVSMKQDYEKLLTEIESAKIAAASDLLAQYNHDLERIDDLRKDFFVALEDNNFEKAKKCIADSVSLRTKLENMTEIDTKVRDGSKKTFESVSELDGILEKRFSEFKQIESIRLVLNAPQRTSDFVENMNKLFSEFPYSAEIKKWQHYKETYLPLVEKIEKGHYEVLSQFKKPLAAIANEENSYQNALSKVKKYFARESDDYDTKPLYCILCEDGEKIMRGFYYNSEETFKKKSGENIRFNALQDEMPESKPFIAQILFQGNSVSKGGGVVFRRGMSNIVGTLLYPDNLQDKRLPGEKALAPHVKKIHAVNAVLQGTTILNLEEDLIKSLQIVCTGDPETHPYPRFKLALKLTQALADVSNEKTVVKLNKELEDRNPKMELTWQDSWMQNFANKSDIVNAVKKDAKMCEKVKNLRISPAFTNFCFAKDFLSQKIKCIGYLIRKQNEWHLVAYNSGELINKEFLLINGDLSGFEKLGIYPKCMQNIQLDRKEAIVPVFVFASGTLKNLESKYKKIAKKEGFELVYPSCWPVKTGD